MPTSVDALEDKDKATKTELTVLTGETQPFPQFEVENSEKDNDGHIPAQNTQDEIDDLILDAEVYSTMENILDIIEVVEDCIMKRAEADITSLIVELSNTGVDNVGDTDVMMELKDSVSTFCISEEVLTPASPKMVIECMNPTSRCASTTDITVKASDTPDDISIDVKTIAVSNKSDSMDMKVKTPMVSDITCDNLMEAKILDAAIAVKFDNGMDVKMSRATDTDDLPNEIKLTGSDVLARISYADAGTGMDEFIFQPDHTDKGTSCDIVMKDASTSMEFDKLVVDVAVGTADDTDQIGVKLAVVVEDLSGTGMFAENESAQMDFEFNDTLDLDVPFFPTKKRRSGETAGRVKNDKRIKTEATFRRKTPLSATGNVAAPKTSVLYSLEPEQNTLGTAAGQGINEELIGTPVFPQDKENVSVGSRPAQSGLRRLGLSKFGKPRKPLHANVQVITKKFETSLTG